MAPNFFVFAELEEYFETNCFKKVEKVVDALLADSKADGIITTEDYSNRYTCVYENCTQKPPFNWDEPMYNMLMSRVALLGKKYMKNSKGRHLYIKFLVHVFKWLDRFYVTRMDLPKLEEVMESSMNKGAARMRWRLAKNRITRMEANAKMQGQVDIWLIKQGLGEWTHAKCKLPHIKRARLV